jgi:hypothetical protein
MNVGTRVDLLNRVIQCSDENIHCTLCLLGDVFVMFSNSIRHATPYAQVQEAAAVIAAPRR